MKSHKNKSRKKFRLKQKLSQWKYLCEFEKDIEELFLSYDDEFNSVLNDILSSTYNPDSKSESEDVEKSDNIKIDFFSEDQKELEGIEEISNQSPEWAKKMYKKIAIETHPDKLEKMNISDKEKSRREEIFKEASMSLKNENYDVLLRLASDLRVDFDIEDEDLLKIVNNSIKRMNNNIEEIQDKASWAWGELEGDTEKRSTLVFNVWNQLKFPKISLEEIRKYINCYENNGDFASLKKQKPPPRSPKTKPPPSLADSRKKK